MTLSSTRRSAFALERSYRREYHADLLDLSSSSATSPALRDLIGAGDLAEVSLGYEPGGGTYDLRAAVAAIYNDLDPDNVIITAGALEAIRAAAMALVEPGQRVIVQEPSYGALRQAVLDAGGYVVDADADLAFLNSPHGPTGAITHNLASIAERVIVDEVYRPITLVPGTTPASCIDTSPRAVSIGDLSKPLGLGGLRIGWIASQDREVIERCSDALDYLSGSVSSLSAAVALRVLADFDQLLAPHLAIARQNLTELAKFVEAHQAWLDWEAPQAGYTACLRIRSGRPPRHFFQALRDAGVFTLDGATFGMPNCLRIGLGLQPDFFCHALRVLGQELHRLPACDVSAPEAEVVLYTKVPRPGEGKSRLAAGIGLENAAVLATAFYKDTLDLQEQTAARRYVALASQSDVAQARRDLPGRYVYPQQGDDMGARLRNAIEFAMQRGATRPVLIGSDSPTLPPHLLSMAHLALDTHDLVIGPALDGGYYLIGLAKPAPALFNGIDWSTDRVLEQTLTRASRENLRVFCLPYWYDVDTVADLERLRKDARPGSATSNALKRIEVHA